MSRVIIYGPQGCGKSRHARALARCFGKDVIVRGWNGIDPLPRECLVLTSTGLVGPLPADSLFVTLEQALADAGIAEEWPKPSPKGEPLESRSGVDPHDVLFAIGRLPSGEIELTLLGDRPQPPVVMSPQVAEWVGQALLSPDDRDDPQTSGTEQSKQAPVEVV